MTKTTKSVTYQKKFQKTDNTIPYSLVGTYEYTKALESFNRLLSISTPDELEVYDRVLNERPEFTFFNGTNTAFQVKPDLKQAQPLERQKFYDQFQKQGLVWMMGLARIELSATESLYGKSEFPFESTRPAVVELPAYLSILSDDVTAHLKSLAQEAGFREVMKSGRKIDSWTLAYLRRLKLSRDMLSTLGRVGDESTRRGIKKNG